ncbi:MAG: S8 family serine peptidase [Caldilineales bacterium]|nr:S8 family serine peptidase [Caldilineales bacterium]
MKDILSHFPVSWRRPGQIVLLILIGALVVAAPILGQSQADGQLSGLVFFDADGDGLRDAGEAGLGGVAIELRDSGGGAVLLASTFTLADGSYLFDQLEYGDYQVSQTPLAGYELTTDSSQSVSVSAGHPSVADFGNLILRTLTGVVYSDFNHNGEQDLTEPGLSSAEIKVIDDLNGNGVVDGGEPVLQQAVSDDQGAYVLADLYPGQRILTVNTISGGVAIDEKPLLIVSAQAGGDDTVDFGWAAGSVAGGPRPQAEQAPNCADDRLTVRFRPETAPGVIDSIFARQHLTLRRYNAALRSFVMTSAPGRAGAAVADLNRLPEVEHATLDCLVAGDSIPAFVPNDPDYNDPSKVYGPQIIDAPAAWDYGFGAGVVVAVVDTGIAMTHTEFISPTNRILPGWNFVADPENNNVQDDNGHGTHVAGIALAAIDNGAGIAGMAGAASILPVKVLNSVNTGYWSDITAGITWAVDQGADVINLSISGPVDNPDLLPALQYAVAHDVLVVAAMGNTGSPTPVYPAYYNETFAVGATTSADVRWSLSNYGSHMDVVAPGATVYSTLWTPADPNTYGNKNGTSMAVPHVAGLAALVRAARPDLDLWNVRAIIEQTAVDKGDPGFDVEYAWGRVDAGAALLLAQSYVTPTPTPTPTLTPTPTPTETPTPTLTPTATPTPRPLYVQRVNSAGPLYTDDQGAAWAADQVWVDSWGFAYASSTARSSTKALNNTTDDPLYQKYREGAGQYIFAVPAGVYSVRLRWAEMAANAPGQRVMRVSIEETVVDDNLDIYAVAGGRYLAWDKTYTAIAVSDGYLVIQFDPVSGSYPPMIAAIEVLETPAPTPTPTLCLSCPTDTPTPTLTPTPTATPYPGQRVNCGGAAYTDVTGHIWDADQRWNNVWGYAGGTSKSSSSAVAGADDDLLYQKRRDKPGSYRFVVPNGVYQVTLKFAEFEVSKATDRLMKITIEGVEVESALDIYAVAGRATALDRVYTAVVSDGELTIVFAKTGGSKKEPQVSAISVQAQ